MSPDPGIPGWFIALFVTGALLSVGTWGWRISVARKIAEDAGLEPNRAAVVTMLSNDGIDAAYLASTPASGSHHQSPHPVERPKTAAERRQELQALKDQGLVSNDEYDAKRQKIIGSI